MPLGSRKLKNLVSDLRRRVSLANGDFDFVNNQLLEATAYNYENDNEDEIEDIAVQWVLLKRMRTKMSKKKK